MNDGKVAADFNPGVPQLDPAVRYHAIEQSNGRVSMEVVFVPCSGLAVDLTCCACKKVYRLGAINFAGTQWRNGEPFNNFLKAHKDCLGPVKEFQEQQSEKVDRGEEGRIFRDE